MAIFAAAVLLLLAVDLGVDYYDLKKKNRLLKEAITDVFRRTFPDIQRIVDPLKQMKVKINETRKTPLARSGTGQNTRIIELLRDVSRLIPKDLDVSFNRLSVEPAGVRISGVTKTFDTVERVKKYLEASVYFSSVQISSANLNSGGSGIRFEMRMDFADLSAES